MSTLQRTRFPPKNHRCGMIVFRNRSFTEVLILQTNTGYTFPQRYVTKDESNEKTAARALEQIGFQYTDVSRLYDYSYDDHTVRYFVGVLTEQARDKRFKPHRHVLDVVWEKDGSAQVKLGKKGAALLQNVYYDLRRDYFSDDDLD